MGNKTNLTNAELELTQKIQLHFPRGIDPDIVNTWNGQPKEVITEAVMEVFGKLPQKPALLGPPSIIATIPGRTENFVVQKNFAKYRGNNFDNWLVGKVDEPMGGTSLQTQPLLRNSKDPGIIAELGGNLKARVTLADIDYAKNNGMLRKDKVYIGYVEDEIRFPEDEAFSYVNEKGKKVVLRAVNFYWDDGGWDANADSVADPIEWHAGHLLLSRVPVNA